LSCVFCDLDDRDIVIENDLIRAIYDRYPVNEGHMLIIPERHFSSFFSATEEEVAAIYEIMHKAKDHLDEKYQPDGYNVGINIGRAAGQTIMHLHVHVIPRYEGDVEDPRGGIRHLKEELVPYKG